MKHYLQSRQYQSIELKELLIAYQEATDNNVICTITDSNGIIIYANSLFCKISQYSLPELVGKSHSIVSANFHSPEFFKDMWNTISHGNKWHGEVKNKAKDGSEYWLDSIVIPIKDNEGNIQQYFSLRTLITEKKKAEQEKTRNIAELEQLLHMLSHEIRQPITTLLGISNIFEKYPSNSEESIKLIGFIKENALALDNFTKKLTLHIHEMKLDEQKKQQLK
jgi:PAS domain S-box-containing protein